MSGIVEIGVGIGVGGGVENCGDEFNEI